MTADSPERDLLEEAAALVRVATHGGVDLRLIGGAAIRLHAGPELHRAFERTYEDIDVVVPRRAARDVTNILLTRGYTANEAVNAANRDRRMIFYDIDNQRKLDVFVGTFEMCHEIPLGDRLSADSLSIPMAELLLTKLQIVELNEKDRRDVLAIMHHHELAEHDANAINSFRIAELLANDWGLWRTSTLNIEKARSGLSDYALTLDEHAALGRRFGELAEQIELHPKSARWKMRARVGDRVRWYQEPEEVE
jgi:hypothetical protein